MKATKFEAIFQLISLFKKGDFKSEDTGEFLLLQNKYSKSLSQSRKFE